MPRSPNRIKSADGSSEVRKQALPPDYARTIQLYDLEDRSVEEVAAAMGRSAGAVFMLRTRALDRLRVLLGDAALILESRT